MKKFLRPLGTALVLALLAAVSWAVYSILLKQIGGFGFPTLQVTRRVFFYGILWMLPAVLALGFSPDWNGLLRPAMLGNFLYLGFGASALCFVTWGIAVETLGPVKTSIYIYLVPVITIASSALILGETLTPMSVLGIFLTLAGLMVSQKQSA